MGPSYFSWTISAYHLDGKGKRLLVFFEFLVLSNGKPWVDFYNGHVMDTAFYNSYESIYPCIYDISISFSNGIGLGLWSFIPEERIFVVVLTI